MVEPPNDGALHLRLSSRGRYECEGFVAVPWRAVVRIKHLFVESPFAADIDKYEVIHSHYDRAHVPLALRLPGLKGGVSIDPALSPDGSAPFHRVGVLEFDSLADAQVSLATPVRQRVAADLAEFATRGRHAGDV